jgi:Ca2+-binding EF-hand superfamily protein
VILGSSFLILFGTTRMDCAADTLPKGLPPWFKELDTDEDGQISLQEWRQAARRVADFRKYDLNGDGFITPEEVLRIVKKRNHLELAKGRKNLRGVIEESPDQLYQGKKSFKIYTIKLEQGKAYQFEMVSQVYYAYLYLESPNGQILDENDSGNVGQISRIVHRAARTGTYRIIATSLGGFRTGPFWMSIRVVSSAAAVPSWFQELDTNMDGQISLQEWRRAGKSLADFRKYDRNGDGYISPEEVLLIMKKAIRLELVKGRANYRGAMNQSQAEAFRDMKSYKFFTVKLEGGKTYEIEMTSRVYFALVYLETPDREVLEQTDRNGFQTSRLVHRAAKTGTYRIIATSWGGVATGPFSLAVRVVYGSAALPAWFKALDTDQDGQVSLHEWRQAGRSLADFRKYDRNGDGYISPEEALRIVKQGNHLELVKGHATYRGAIDQMQAEAFQGRKSYKVFTIKLEGGKNYQIQMTSQAYFAYLYLETPDGELVEQNDQGGFGLTRRLVHRAARTGTYRIIATSLGGWATGPFTLTIGIASGSAALPAWFKELDTDQDGQVSLHAWRQAGKSLADFRKYDRDGDGFISPEEVLRIVKKGNHLELVKGRATYRGAIDEMQAEEFQGRRSYKVFTIKLERGKSYQIQMTSQAYFAYLYLETPEGEIVQPNSGGGFGLTRRLVHRAARTGSYRIIATSLGGWATGPFTLAIQVVSGTAAGPAWFKEVDTDQDGQISLHEWRQAGKSLDDFRKYDRNGDGFITPEEALRGGKQGSHLELVKGRANFRGAIEQSPTETYQGKPSFKVYTIRLERGKTYQIEMVSPEYFSYLYLESPNGQILVENDSGGFGQTSRIVHQATRTGTYRIIATTQAGVRTGPFRMSIRVVSKGGAILPQGLPPWFKQLDTDQDGQISLREWRQGRRKLADFRKYDLNGDGFITPQEVLKFMQSRPGRRK